MLFSSQRLRCLSTSLRPRLRLQVERLRQSMPPRATRCRERQLIESRPTNVKTTRVADKNAKASWLFPVAKRLSVLVNCLVGDVRANVYGPDAGQTSRRRRRRRVCFSFVKSTTTRAGTWTIGVFGQCSDTSCNFALGEDFLARVSVSILNSVRASLKATRLISLDLRTNNRACDRSLRCCPPSRRRTLK